LNCSILSADSRQFYKELSIGTAKPSKEEMQGIPHYFIDNLSITSQYTSGQFELEALQVLDNEFKTKDISILVGGSGLYIDAVCKGIDDLPRDKEVRKQLIQECEEFGLEKLQNELKKTDENYYNQCDLQNPHRVMRALEVIRCSGKRMSEQLSKTIKNRDFEVVYFTINYSREKIYKRINNRVLHMIENGLVEEVKSVAQYRDHQALNTVGYKEIFDYLDGLISLEEAISQIQQNTRRYAKRQLTWFRREVSTHWINHEDLNDQIVEILEVLEQNKKSV